MTEDISIKKAEEIIKSLEIPIQMTIVNILYKEIKKKNPNIKKIVDETSKDVGLSAAVLRLSNSPFFACGGINSIGHAINIVGLRNFFNIVVSSIYQNAFDIFKDKVMLKQFWQHSMIVARSMAFIARKTRIIDENDAYITGLFHDCAIPSFIIKYADYIDIFELALSSDESVIKIENDSYKTNHCIGGLLLTKAWNLPDCVPNIIQYHHNKDVRIHGNPVYRKLAAAHHLAECMSYYYGSLTNCITKTELPFRNDIKPENISYQSLFDNNDEWAVVFQELQLNNDDLEDLQNDIYEMINKY